MSNYNNLQADDTMVVNNGSSSYSVTVENVATGENLQDTDVFLVNRGDKSYSVTKQQLSEEIGASGEIEAPVVVITPPNGAGLAGDDVAPSAEGITAVTETATTAPTYSTLLTSDGTITSPEQAFDGKVDGAVYAFTAPNGTYLDANFTGLFSGTHTFTVHLDAGTGLNVQYTDENGTTDLGAQTINVDFEATNITNIRVTGLSSGAIISGISVDGAVLIDGVVTYGATLTYTTNSNLNLLADGQAMTQQPAYTPVTDTIESVDETTTSVKYAIAPSDVPITIPDTPTVSDQTGLTFVSATAGQTFTGNDHYIYDQGANPKEPLRIVPLSGTAGYCYSDDLINWTFTPDGGSSAPELDNPLDKGRYIWIQSSPNGYAGLGWSITGGVSSQPTLTFDTPKDLVNFRPGDVAKAVGTNNPAWNETQIWSDSMTATGSFIGGRPVENIFTGELGNVGGNNVPGVNGGNVGTLTFNPPITGSLIELNGSSNIDARLYINDPTMNSGGMQVLDNAFTGTIWNDSGVTSISSITFYSTASYAAYLRAIRVDGKILVDATSLVTTVSVDAANNKMIVDGGTWSNGETITGSAYAGKGEYVSHTGTEIELTNVTGRWCVDEQGVGLDAQSDDIYTSENPGWDGLEFQSANGADESTAFSGEGCTLRDIKWTLESSSGDQSGPWENTTEYALSVSYAVGDEVLPWSGPGDNLLPDTYYRVKVQYIADSGADPITSEWNVFKTEGDEKPSVNMSGLRFDRSRLTRLSRTIPTTTGTTFTFSAWVKPTAISEPNRLFAIYINNAATYSMARIATDRGILCYLNENGSSQPITSAKLQLNAWNHVFISVDNGVWKVTLNGGTTQNMGTSTNPSNPGSLFTIGGFEQATNNNECIDGYLSDVYFVDGQALEPSAFGKDYAGLWGPISSETILNNITRAESPYDQRPNMDEKWSDNLSTNVGFISGRGPEKAFNGIINNNNDDQTNGGNGSTIRWIGYTAGTYKVRVWGFRRTTQNLTYSTLDAGSNPQNDIISKNVISTDNTWGWIDFGTVSDFTGIQVSSNDSNTGGVLGAVEIDGRILVDGPADNTQNWSDYVTKGSSTNNPISDMFDGITGSGGFTTLGGTSTIDFPTPIGSSSLRFWGSYGSTGATIKVYWDGGSYTYGGDGINNWVDFTPQVTFPITKIEMSAATTGTNVQAWEVDGALLVDSGAQWDTSQVWSDAQDTAYFQQPVTLAFDGDTNTKAEFGVNNTVPFDLLGLEDVTKVEILTQGTSQSCSVLLNNTDSGVTISPGQSKGWVSIYDGSAITLNGISFVVGGVSQPLYAIRVDGQILVDAGTLGDNGFYLPFDPAQTGGDYSSTYTGDAPRADRNQIRLFDGRVDTFVVFEAATPKKTGTYTFNEKVNTSLRVHGRNTTQNASNGSLTITYTDNTTFTPSFTGSDVWTPDPTAAGKTIKSVQITGSSSGTDGYFSAIEVDGAILIDHSAIGKDLSGNGNHFIDKNFAVGNTDKVWSNSQIDYTGGSANNLQPVTAAFDGQIHPAEQGAPNAGRGAFWSANNNVTEVLTFEPPIPTGSGVRVFVQSSGTVQV